MTTILPDPATLAAEIRDTSLTDVAQLYGATVGGVAKRLNLGGYTRDGEQSSPRAATVTTLPAYNIRPGRLRETRMPADAKAACVDYPEVFAAVLDAHATTAIRQAKAICADCPVLDLCLTVHGRDYELGVVAGKTDRERKAHFKASV